MDLTVILFSYNLYQAKSHEFKFYSKIIIPISTVYYHEQTTFYNFYNNLRKLQDEQIKKLNIKPSGIFCYDEQYVFVDKVMYMRMTIIDAVTKLIIGEKVVAKDDFDNTTILNFFQEKLKGLPLEVIITDGRQGYTDIIKAAGAIHHRCFFHIMQNLMTPLQKRINKLERTNKENQKKIKRKSKENTKIITELSKKYKQIKGRTRKDDKERIKDNTRKDKPNTENKKLTKEIKENTNELKEYMKDIERIQNIWKSKNKKEARRRINTLYNERNHHQPIIKRFIKKK